METLIELTCDVCKTQFHRKKAEYNRTQKKGLKRVFCSRKCCGVGVVDNIPKEKRYHPENLNSGNRGDHLSPFRWHFRNSKRRSDKRKIDFDLTLEYLKELWERQDGVCPYTGWNLKQMSNTAHSNQLERTPDRASLDRIDSSKGYIKGNVQFVSLIAQHAKHTFSNNDLKRFCESVVNHV